MGLLIEDSVDSIDQHMMELPIRSQSASRLLLCRRNLGQSKHLQAEVHTSVCRDEQACRQAPAPFLPWREIS